jgi:hypothetical protein
VRDTTLTARTDRHEDRAVSTRKGDGLSAHEEYRGFLVMSQHRRTDETPRPFGGTVGEANRGGPHGKDMFLEDSFVAFGPERQADVVRVELPVELRVVREARGSRAFRDPPPADLAQHAHQEGLRLDLGLTGGEEARVQAVVGHGGDPISGDEQRAEGKSRCRHDPLWKRLSVPWEPAGGLRAVRVTTISTPRHIPRVRLRADNLLERTP